jgi:hypothetical protein
MLQPEAGTALTSLDTLLGLSPDGGGRIRRLPRPIAHVQWRCGWIVLASVLLEPNLYQWRDNGMRIMVAGNGGREIRRAVITATHPDKKGRF